MNSLNKEMSQFARPGPKIAPRPRLPNDPNAGCVKLAALNHWFTVSGIATVPGGFTYTLVLPGLPVVVSLVPATGPVLGGTAIVITGTNLTGASVTIGGVPVTGVSVNVGGTVLVGVAPAGAIGIAPVVVTNASGSVTVPGGFLYVFAFGAGAYSFDALLGRRRAPVPG